MTGTYGAGRKWTLAEIRAASSGCFFAPQTLRFFGETMANFRVVQDETGIYVKRVKPAAALGPSGGVGVKWQFNPDSGALYYVSG